MVACSMQNVQGWVMDEGELIERLAALEHEQWTWWAKGILGSEPISKRRRERWERCMVPYDQLPEDIKEADRIWARKVLAVLLPEEAT